MKVSRQTAIATTVLLLSLTMVSAGEPDQATEEWAKSFMHEAIVIDTHCDTLMLATDRGYRLSERHDDHHIDIPRLREGGVDGQFFACFIYPDPEQPGYVKQTLRMIDALYQAAAEDEHLQIAYNADDIMAAHQQGRVAGILAIEGGHAIEDDLGVLRMFHRLGVRYLTLTWMNNNSWADASGPDQSRWGDIPDHGGLTELGREVIREMNRLGMIVDVSHVSDETFWDVLEVTDKPVIASHSCAWALNPHYRNVKDDMLKALAENGGVIGINFAPSFLSQEYDTASQEIREKAGPEIEALRELYREDREQYFKKRGKVMAKYQTELPEVTVSDLCDHIEHVVKVAGIDHVGLGSDFDGISAAPEHLDDTTDLFRIVVELRNRGWSQEHLHKLLGLNTLRVIRANVGG
jgi:membrane dipeptidase